MNIKDYKIVFLGTPDISATLLEKMINYGFNISLVVTQCDKPTGRNKKIEESPVSKIAKKYNIDVIKPIKLNKDYSKIEEIKPDLLLTYAYGQIISTTVLSLSKFKPLNLHASILPKYRGASPIQTCLLNGDKETGISLMEMEKGMDTGKVYAINKLDIKEDDNYTSLKERLTKLAFDMVKNYLPLYFENKMIGVKQNEEEATFTKMIKKEDEHLNINDDSSSFINKVRALSLTPGSYLFLNDEIIKIYKATYINNSKLTDIGKILKYQKKLVLQLKDGIISLDLIQRQGKKMMSGIDYLNGIKNIDEVILM